ncbi:MAG: hypothetical protein NZ108_09570, partial [Bacteroidia bacterium]|nr:hypothetical protein [Bacteroidia bacterium]
LAYSGLINQFIAGAGGTEFVTPNSHDAARRFADYSLNDRGVNIYEQLVSLIPSNEANYRMLAGGIRKEPGSPEFQQAFDEITGKVGFANGGSKFYDKTWFYHTEAQYDFKNEIKWFSLIVGGSYRQFFLNSAGTIFSDTAGRKLTNREIGFYAQAIKEFGRLKVIASTRFDKNNNFKAQFTPRIALVYSIDEKRNHNVRASFQTGFRTPTLQAQYIDLDLGAFRYIGGLRESDENYKIIDNNYTLNSVNQFIATGDESKLQRFKVEDVKPESVQNIEVGYKGLFFNKLFVDANGFWSYNENFLGAISFIGPKKFGESGRDTTYTLTAADILAGRYTNYRRYTNTTNAAIGLGGSIGLGYSFNNHFQATGSYTYTELKLSEEAQNDEFITSFNTPKHKVTLGISGRKIKEHWGFAINYRWNDAFRFNDGFGIGPVPAYNLVDLQVSYTLPKYKTQFRIGGTNVLNNRHIEAF